MLDYFQKFAAVAERPELASMINVDITKLKAHLATARQLQAAIAKADSVKSKEQVSNHLH